VEQVGERADAAVPWAVVVAELFGGTAGDDLRLTAKGWKETVMRYAGPRMLRHHPILALRHWRDSRRKRQ